MKKLFIAGNVTYPVAPADPTAIADGAVGIYIKNGSFLAAPTGTGDPVLDEFISLCLGRSIANGGPKWIDRIPLKGLEVVKSAAVAATTFTSKVTVPSPVVGNVYTIVVAKIATVPNQRFKYSATVKAVTGDTASTIATKLKDLINANSSASGVTATSNAADVTITAKTAGDPYKVIPSDDLYGATVSAVTLGAPGINDAAYIKDLARQCASDSGFEYTYNNDGEGIYPGYNIDPSGTFVLYTFTYTSGRAGRRTDEPITSVFHLAVPTGAAQIATLDAILALDRNY